MKAKLYIMQSGDFIKVGVTTNSVIHRAKQIQTGCPLPIEEIEYIDFDTKAEAYHAEKVVHNKFSFYNSHGEWFVKFKKYTSLICSAVDKRTSDIKRVNFNSHINFHVNEIAAKRKQIRDRKKESLDRILSTPKFEGEIRAHARIDNKERQKKIEKAIKNNPLLSGILS